MNHRVVIIFLAVVICLLLSVVVNVLYGIDIVYTHLFYIPIILTGIWYPRYAGLVAASLGLIHIASDYYKALEVFKFGSLLRAVMFMVVAYVTSRLTLRRDRLLNSLRENDEALKQSHDELENRVADRTEELSRVNKELQEEVTEHKQAEEKIKASLQEKEILLNESHHRVKNNLQMISSLLKLQIMANKNPELIESFHKSQDRIQSMAMVHEKLYNSNDFNKLELANYVKALSQELFNSYKINPREIDLIVKTDGDVYLDVNKAIPCGLILNELISNALKHAFPGGRQSALQIIIRQTENAEIEIIVRDNGLGLPDDVDIHEPQTLGLDLVNGLVKNQLDGQIEVKRDKGTEFRIKFPI